MVGRHSSLCFQVLQLRWFWGTKWECFTVTRSTRGGRRTLLAYRSRGFPLTTSATRLKLTIYPQRRQRACGRSRCQAVLPRAGPRRHDLGCGPHILRVSNIYYSSPALDDSGDAYITTSRKLVKVSTDGRVLWSWPSNNSLSISHSPVIGQDGKIYFAGYSDSLYALNPGGCTGLGAGPRSIGQLGPCGWLEWLRLRRHDSRQSEPQALVLQSGRLVTVVL